MKPYFGRLITAMITFFHEDGSLNAEETAEFASWLVDHGSDAILVAGTSGEAPTLTYDEKKELFTAVIKKLDGRAPVIVGTGSNDTAQTLNMNKLAEEVGADGVLVVGPFYNKPSQEGFYQHFKTVAEHTKLPILVYNVPGRTGTNIKPLTMARLVKNCPNIVGIKEASGNITQMDDIIKNKPENFDVISGDDGITFPLITLGAVGVISVIGNAFPREFSRMTRLALAGDYASALTIHHKFTELFKLLFVDGNPAGVKAMLNMMGMIKNRLRLPLVPTRITTYEEMRKILDELKIKY